MRRALTVLFSTFVLFAISFSQAWAAKEKPRADLSSPPTDETETKAPGDDVVRSTFDVPQPTPGATHRPRSPGYFHADHYGLTVDAGGLIDTSPTTISTHSENDVTLAGIQMMWTTDSGRVYEAGADLMSDGTGALAVTRRWISGQEALRPYLKAGVGLWVNPQDQLGILVNFHNLRLIGAAGLEQHVSGHSSLRFEIGGGLGSPLLTPYPAEIDARVGWVWSWP